MLAQSWCADTAEARSSWVSLDAGRQRRRSGFWTYVATARRPRWPVDRRTALARLRTPGGTGRRVAVDELVNGLASLRRAARDRARRPAHASANERVLRLRSSTLSSICRRNARILATDPASIRRCRLGRLRARAAARRDPGRASSPSASTRRASCSSTREGIALDDERPRRCSSSAPRAGRPGCTSPALWLRDFDRARERACSSFSGRPPPRRRVPGRPRCSTRSTSDAREFLVRSVGVRPVLRGRCATSCWGAPTRSRCCAELERANGFLVALDAPGEWFRYHHLFRDLLGSSSSAPSRRRGRSPSARERAGSPSAGWSRRRSSTHGASATPRTSCGILREAPRRLVRSDACHAGLRGSTQLPDDVVLDDAGASPPSRRSRPRDCSTARWPSARRFSPWPSARASSDPQPWSGLRRRTRRPGPGALDRGRRRRRARRRPGRRWRRRPARAARRTSARSPRLGFALLPARRQRRGGRGGGRRGRSSAPTSSARPFGLLVALAMLALIELRARSAARRRRRTRDRSLAVGDAGRRRRHLDSAGIAYDRTRSGARRPRPLGRGRARLRSAPSWLRRAPRPEHPACARAARPGRDPPASGPGRPRGDRSRVGAEEVGGLPGSRPAPSAGRTPRAS